MKQKRQEIKVQVNWMHNMSPSVDSSTKQGLTTPGSVTADPEEI